MQLLIDYGNTRIKWALLQQGEFSFGGEALYENHTLDSLLKECWGDLPEPAVILCASVSATALNRQLDNWCRQQWQREITWLQSAAQQQGVTSAYQQPGHLGADRWAALIAAHRLTSHHVGIIDCGTAVTIDLLRADGQHLGGYIVPGLWVMQQCLLTHTSQIQATPVLTDETGPGDSTQACISQGATRTLTALLDSVMHDMQQQYDNRFEWLVTGGDAYRLETQLRGRCRVVPDLVLRGLGYLVEGNE